MSRVTVFAGIVHFAVKFVRTCLGALAYYVPEFGFTERKFDDMMISIMDTVFLCRIFRMEDAVVLTLIRIMLKDVIFQYILQNTLPNYK